MKFLKFRYIFTLAIVLVIGITLMVYFFGGLSATALVDSNMEFSYEGYLDYSEYDAEGNRYVVYETEEAMEEAVKDLDPSTYEKSSANNIHLVKYKLNSAKIVAQNDNYTMFLDEKTTIVTVAVNNTYKLPTPEERTSDGFIKYDLAQFDITYDSAVKTDNSGPGKSNLLLRYVGSNAKESSITFNTFANSVAYEDLLLGQKQRHYKINFDIENGIEILYEIGDFTVYESFFPKKIDRNDFFNYFRGNLVFVVNSTSILSNNALEYSNMAYTWSKECADYLASKEIATVTPNYSGSTARDENGELIPTRYDLTDILEPQRDSNGDIIMDPITNKPKTTNVLKLKANIDFNPSDINADDASPCITNPFANSFTLQDLFINFYILQQKDDNNPEITYTTDWRFNTPNLSPTFTRRATGALQNTKMYEYMYKLNTQLEPNYLYEHASQVTITEANYAQYVENYPGINIGDRLIIKTPVSYYEDLSKVFFGYFKDGKFYEDALFTKLLTNTDAYNDFVDRKTYNSYVLEDGTFVRSNKAVPVGGYQARDEDGNFLYDEDGNPVQQVFTVDLANVQNEKFGIESEVTPPIFQIAMRFVLTDKGMQTTILDNSIREGLGKKYVDAEGKRTQYSHDLKISRLEVLPFFTTNADSNSKGQIIVPDGSGAIITFNSPKAALGYPATEKRIYGPDKAFTFDRTQPNFDNEKLMFGMYGFLDQTNRKGVLAIVDKGASQSSIYANFKRNTPGSRNFAYFTALIREKEEVFVGSARTSFIKWSQQKSNTDFSYMFQFLSEDQFVDSNGKIEYVTLAKEYRKYLIDKYNLEEKDTTKHNVLAINFLGAFEKREVTFGFAHNVDYSLTSFEQAQNIIKELQDEGALGFSVAYTAWTRDSMEPRATNNVKVSKILGDAKGIKSFKQFLEENNINLYPEVRITSNKGYDYSFGNMKYTAKGVGSTYAQHREYDLATRRASETIEPITMLSPVYYMDYITGFFKSYDKLGINSAYLSDIGNVTVGDYSRTRITYAEQGLKYQQQALDHLQGQLSSIMMSAPYDYALKYVDYAVNVPVQSTLLGYYDYSIPLYQLVVSGLFDYSGPAVNYDSEHDSTWYLLKSIETGSNLQFLISANDPKILLKTDYTMYYESYYINSKNDIISMNKTLNEIGIHESRLESHKILRDDVVEVEYANGLRIVINYTDSYYNDFNSGLLVRPNWFVVVQEAYK